MAEMKVALAYARYSSDLQREESIGGQLRAIDEYAKRNNYVIRHTYCDRGLSGTNADRPEFLAMIDEVRRGGIDAVIVHKGDRFSRNRYDSIIYKRELEKFGTAFISVSEQLCPGPEGVILESLLEGLNEYYSRNLSREVMKGLKENALSGRHTGGKPCLGYSLNRETMKLEIDEWEAEAVRLIFKRYLEGEGYTSIIRELNERGFKTKRGCFFGKNSLYEILRNEKYTGVYTYNVSASKSAEGKYNRHKRKDDSEIIRIEGGVPAIISAEDFAKVQEMMKARQRKTATFKARQEYLLSGKIVCGECGGTYSGNSRKPNPTHPLYVSYRCTRNNGTVKCSNHEIQRDKLELIVMKQLAEKVFDERFLPEILARYNDFAASKNTELQTALAAGKAKLSEVERGISNIVNVIMQTGSAALSEKLKELEKDKAILEDSIAVQERELTQTRVSEKELKKAFKKAKDMLESGTLANRKAIIQCYVKVITMYHDKIVMEFNVTGDYIITEEVDRF